jgi:hypothetical protein
MATQAEIYEKLRKQVNRNLTLVYKMKKIYKDTRYNAIDCNSTLDKIFDRIENQMLNIWSQVYERVQDREIGDKRIILDEKIIKFFEEKNKFLLTQSKKLIKHMEIARSIYDEDNEENPEFMKMAEIWSKFSYKL